MTPSDEASPFRQVVLGCLERMPVAFLSALGWHLGVSARASYVEAGVPPGDAIERVESLNEVLVVVLEQLRSLSRGEPAYPDEVLLDVLSEKAKVGGRSGDLRWAVERALQDVDLWGPPIG